jgi:hypothetical protein
VTSNDADFKQAVEGAVYSVLGESRPMPTPASVTEITIRVGPPDALQTVGSYGYEQARCCCTRRPQASFEGLTFSKSDGDLLQQITDATGVGSGELVQELWARAIAREARDFMENSVPAEDRLVMTNGANRH